MLTCILCTCINMCVQLLCCDGKIFLAVKVYRQSLKASVLNYSAIHKPTSLSREQFG